jgi:hypothetical protein
MITVESPRLAKIITRQMLVWDIMINGFAMIRIYSMDKGEKPSILGFSTLP